MGFDQYSIYSKVSENNETTQRELEEITSLIRKFDEIDTISSAKQYLESTWNITEEKTKYPLGDGCLISLKETNSFFKINLLIKNENITYLYEKQKESK